MKDGQKFIGLDVSKDIIAVGIADEGRSPSRFHGNIQNTPEAIRKLFKKLGDPEKLLVCYEAGSSGYSIYRQLLSMDIECIVVAPTLIPKRTGDRDSLVKNDKLEISKIIVKQT
ncbi:hypothetical protein RAH41_14120 [Gottfriedia acidiceleris]|uniref:hypothetical protein n=1 Tax=Gottfriedia acidiceleris TaxID=371036 RepID=UPI002F26023C